MSAEDLDLLRARLDRMTRLALAQTALSEAGLDLDAFMQAIVARLGELTNAAGAIVELAEGDDLVYRAATNPAHIGNRLARKGSFSGLCVETAQVLVCDDALEDDRVDREACLRVGVRSMICAPLMHAGQAIGALKVFSGEPAAFGDDDLDALRLMAAMLGAQISRRQEHQQREALRHDLQAKEERLASIIAHAHQAIVTMNQAGEVTGWNGHAEQIFGWKAAEVLGRSMAEVVVPEELRAAHAAGLARYLASEQAVVVGQRIEVPALRRNGETFPVELAISATRGAGGWEFTALMHDISERRAQEELFENAFNHAPIGMALVSLEGRFVKMNEHFCGIIGYPVDEALALDFQTITHADDLEADLELLHKLLAGEIPSYRMDKRYIHKDGATIWIRLSVSLVLGADGAPKHFIAQIQDQTATRDAEQRYRLMAHNATDIIVTSALNGRSTFVSPAVETVTGFSVDEMLGSSPLSITHPDDKDGLLRVFRSLLDGGSVGRVRWRLRHKVTNDWIWLESQPALLRDEVTGEPIGYLDVIRDITAQKAQEDALAQARLDAEAASRSKADFLANMSHELRTPLNSIIGFTRLLTESQGLCEEDQRRVELVHGAGQALHAVIDNVLDFSKLEAAALELHDAPFDLSELLSQTVALLEPQAAAKDLRLKAMIDSAAPRAVIGDVGRLRQVLLNLLSNAVKFTAKGGVTASLTAIGGAANAPRVRIEITDTGSGIAQEKLTGLFNRFVQAGSSVSAHYGGTGLGLAISKQLVSLMGGEIGVESDVGKGSTFWLELALPLADGARSTALPADNADLELTGRRILVVDDVELNRELMLAMLSKYGCEISLAKDGAEAVVALRATPFDLVLMDCQMPVMDGFEATRVIRASDQPWADTPIVALTASAQPEHLARCEASGMNDHLTKPLNPGKLEQVLGFYLRSAPRRIAPTPVDAGAEARRDLVAALGAPAVLSLLSMLRRQLVARDIDADTPRDRVREDAHTLAGSAGLMGFVELSQACRDLEEVIASGADHHATLDLTDRLVRQTMDIAERWEIELTVAQARQVA